MKYNNDELMVTFNLFDKDKLGYISSNDFIMMMNQFGSNYTIDDFNNIMKHINCNFEGKITFEVFSQIMNNKFYLLNNKEFEYNKDNIKNIFSVFDKQNNNKINAIEFKHLLMNYSKYLTEEDIDKFIKLGETNNSGYIDINQLISVLL